MLTALGCQNESHYCFHNPLDSRWTQRGALKWATAVCECGQRERAGLHSQTFASIVNPGGMEPAKLARTTVNLLYCNHKLSISLSTVILFFSESHFSCTCNQMHYHVFLVFFPFLFFSDFFMYSLLSAFTWIWSICVRQRERERLS